MELLQMNGQVRLNGEMPSTDLDPTTFNILPITNIEFQRNANIDDLFKWITR